MYIIYVVYILTVGNGLEVVEGEGLALEVLPDREVVDFVAAMRVMGCVTDQLAALDGYFSGRQGLPGEVRLQVHVDHLEVEGGQGGQPEETTQAGILVGHRRVRTEARCGVMGFPRFILNSPDTCTPPQRPCEVTVPTPRTHMRAQPPALTLLVKSCPLTLQPLPF
jgi:hypothetical protein